MCVWIKHYSFRIVQNSKTMKSNLSILALLLISLFSCRDDDMSSNQNDPLLDDPRLISNIVWETYIDEDFEDLVEASNTQIYDLTHPIICDELIVYYNWWNNGFVALNRDTGEEVWNNYGQILCSNILNPPIMHEGALYFICYRDIYKVDVNSGNIITSFRWLDETEALDTHIAIINGELYLQTYPAGQSGLVGKWYSSPVDNLSPNSFSNFNVDEAYMLDIPQQATNADGHSLLIYTTKVRDLCLTAFNLITNTTEWQFCDFGDIDRNSDPIIDGNNAIALITNQGIHKVDLHSGELIWNTEILSKDYDEFNDAFIDTDFGYFYIGRDGSRLIDKNSGENIWSFERFTLDDGSEKTLRKGKDTPIAINNKVYYFDGVQAALITQDLVSGDIEYNFINPRKNIRDVNFGIFGNFTNSQKIISEDNILYTADAFTMLAFPLPE